jgi:hypothetical protein
MRGRNNRKGPNPLTRTYESNGPDVKIRGTAHHVAEKYLQLARDAQSSGDPVMAESYLQHAEHYFRLIASAQLAQAQAQMGYQRAPGEPDMEEMEDDDDMGGLPDRFASPPERFSPPPQQGYGGQQQPYGQPSFGGQQPQQPPMAPPNQPQPFIDRPAFGGERQHGQPYQGERNAGFTPLQQQYQQEIGGLQTPRVSKRASSRRDGLCTSSSNYERARTGWRDSSA